MLAHILFQYSACWAVRVSRKKLPGISSYQACVVSLLSFGAECWWLSSSSTAARGTDKFKGHINKGRNDRQRRSEVGGGYLKMNGAVSLVCAIASTVLVSCCSGVHVLAVSRLNIKVFSKSKYIPWTASWRASEARALLSAKTVVT
jgi:uncharacterized protein YsxB (DUF464 family)